MTRLHACVPLTRVDPPASHRFAIDRETTMTERKTAALRLISTEPLAAGGAAATTPATDATDHAADRTRVPARGPATTSPIRRWRSAPRPVSWQPGTWGDAL
jgi:hypothetical protein